MANSPLIGSDCEEIRIGYRKYAKGKHLIFFHLQKSDAIEIVRVLHTAMDIDQYL